MALNAFMMEKEGVDMIKKQKSNKIPGTGNKVLQNSLKSNGVCNEQVVIEGKHRDCSKINKASPKKRVVSSPIVSKNLQAGLEKSNKELQKQLTSLSHLKIVFSERTEKSYKRINEVFKELHQQLTERQSELTKQVDDAKRLAGNTLETFKQTSIDLKRRIDRANSTMEDEIEKLKLDIKDFFAHKRYFEDVSQSSKFNCDLNKILIDIQEFGEVYLAKSVVKNEELCPETNGIPETTERILSQSESLLEYESTAPSDLSNEINPTAIGTSAAKNRGRNKRFNKKRTKFSQQPIPQPHEEHSSTGLVPTVQRT